MKVDFSSTEKPVIDSEVLPEENYHRKFLHSIDALQGPTYLRDALSFKKVAP